MAQAKKAQEIQLPAAEIYVVTRPFATTVDGAPRVIPAGTTIAAGHPLLRGNAYVKPFEVTYDHERDQRRAAEAAAAREAGDRAAREAAEAEAKAAAEAEAKA